MAGVIERSGRGRAVLRVTPRFLAHVERTAGLRHITGDEAVRAALASWADPTPRGATATVAAILEGQQSVVTFGTATRCIAA